MSDVIPAQIKRYRWLVLQLCCAVVCGRYYSFDLPAATYDQLQQQFRASSEANDFVVDFSLIYSAYCAPNIFLPLFGGHLIDKFGNRTMLIIFSVLAFLGQMLVAFGCSSINFNIILLGRFIFGMGESLNVCLITILSSYFADTEMALAIIVMFIFSRICSFFNYIFSPIIEIAHSVSMAFWVGALLCCLSAFAALILSEVDGTLKSPYSNLRNCKSKLYIGQGTYTNKRLAKVLSNNVKSPSSDVTELPVVSEEGVEEDIDGTMLANNIIAELQEKRQGYGTFSGQKRVDIRGNENQENMFAKSPDPLVRSFVCLALVCFCVYGSILPFIDLANPIIDIGFFENAHYSNMSKYDEELWVSRLQSIPIVLFIITSPIVASVVDYQGHRTTYLVFASLLLIFGHAIIASRLGNISFLVLALILIGAAYGIAMAVIWTSVQFMFAPNRQGLATGALLSVYHLAQTAIPIIVSYILTAKVSFLDSHVSKQKYIRLEVLDIQNCEAFFASIAIMALLFTFILFIIDESSGGKLRKSGSRFKEYELIPDSVSDESDGERRQTDVVPKQRPRSKSMSDSAPLSSCMRKYYSKQRNKFKSLDIDDNDTDGEVESDSDSTDLQNKRRRCVSFAGDCDFTHERKRGQGQHPSVHLVRNSVPVRVRQPASQRMFFAHF